MLPTEAAALGMAIEEMEKPAAFARMTEGRNQHSEPSAPGSRGLDDVRPRDIAAEAAGLSRATFVQIKTAIVASEAVGMGEPTYRRLKTLVTPTVC